MKKTVVSCGFNLATPLFPSPRKQSLEDTKKVPTCSNCAVRDTIVPYSKGIHLTEFFLT